LIFEALQDGINLAGTRSRRALTGWRRKYRAVHTHAALCIASRPRIIVPG
jgi:hypothetical protein